MIRTCIVLTTILLVFDFKEKLKEPVTLHVLSKDLIDRHQPEDVNNRLIRELRVYVNIDSRDRDKSILAQQAQQKWFVTWIGTYRNSTSVSWKTIR